MSQSATGPAIDAGEQKRILNRPAGLAWRLLRCVLIAYLLVLLGMMVLEESLIFFPSRYPEGNWQTGSLDVEDAHFQAADGTRLHGWFMAHPSPRAVALLAHGNAGNITDRLDWLEMLHELGVSVMVFDYRGYGRSAGSPTEAGILADARAARSWLAQRAGVAEDQIVLVGESLGGGVVVDLAAKDGARGLILENTFSSLPDVAALHYAWIPVRLLMKTRLDSAAAISGYHGPLLQIHGEADTIIPISLGRRLFAAANEPKWFVVIPGADHNDPRTPAYTKAVAQFLSEL